MTQTLRALMLALVAVAALASPAFAQLQAPNRRDVVERVASACPGFIRQDHAFTDAVATLLNREDARWGRNGKRGNANDPSHDAIAFRNPGSPFGVSIVDIIGAAGSSSASPAWIDQTQATIDARTTGVWVAPSGRLPACLSGGTDTPPPPPPPPPPPVVDLAPILAKLSAIESRLTRIEAMEPANADLGLLNEYVDDMVGNGPGEGSANHITDIKQRQDAALAEIARMFAWLRSRRALGF